jgi:hypothetical protein
MPATQLTTDGADSEVPRWSAGSNRLVCESARALDGSDAVNSNETYNVWSLAPDGSDAVPLTSTTATDASNFAPSFAR